MGMKQANGSIETLNESDVEVINNTVFDQAIKKAGNIMEIFTIDQRDLIIALTVIVSLVIFIPVFTYVAFANDLTSPQTIINSNNTGVILLDRNDKPFFTFYQAKNIDYISISQIPKLTQQAVISGEDKQFYIHSGFSPKAILGSIIADLKQQKLAYGGSTITQQLVKISLLSNNKNFLRKYQEITLAEELERRYSKDQILEMYLNSVYFGEGSFGIEDASLTYFGKHAKDLDLAQSSMLAGLLPAPTKYSPISGDFNEAKIRQEYILTEMVSQKYITPDQATKAYEEKLQFQGNPQDINNTAFHFALMVRQELINKYGEAELARSGFKVKTTLDLAWQEYAQDQVKKQVARLGPNRVSNGAAVVIDPRTGEIKALVGSKDWNDPTVGKVNIITSQRQPGSSFKPIVYSYALENQMITPSTMLNDSPTTYKGVVLASKAPAGDGSELYTPANYDHSFRGPVLVRRALANSLNVPAVQVMSMVGVDHALSQAKKLGITTLGDSSNYGLSLVLGAGEVRPLDLTTAYATFANKGKKITPTDILEIKDKSGHTTYKYQPHEEQVLNPGVAYQISKILSDKQVRQEEFGPSLDTTVNAAVKTGTTSDYKDAWTMGYTDTVAVGVWVGNNDNTSMDQIAGSLGAAPIFKALVEKFSEGPANFEKPTGIVAVSVCRFNGQLLREATTSGYTENFLAGTVPTKNCQVPSPTPASSPSGSPGASPPPSSSPPPTPPPAPEQNGEKKDTPQGGQTQTINLPNGGQVIIENYSQSTSSYNDESTSESDPSE
jgi:1A family penicillin-binding protein